MFITESKTDTGVIPSSKVDKDYAYWRFRLMYSLIIGYASFYIVRQNFNIAMPSMLKEFGYTKTDIGWIITAFNVIYGVSKFISGSICDRSNARYFMATGLLGAALLSVWIGLCNSIIAIGVLYAMNGWFQSMGWPACTRILTRWHHPRNLATKWGMCNVSHQIGSVVVLMGGAWIVEHYGWKQAFIIPGILCVGLAGLIFERLRDTPESLGLPSIEEKEGGPSQACAIEEENETMKDVFFRYIVPNKMLWAVCFANFFLYIVRMGFFTWAPTLFKEGHNISLIKSGSYAASFELAGLFGGIIAGWLSDKLFAGYRGRVGFLFMLSVACALFAFWYTPVHYPMLDISLMTLIGFFIYGPQVLVGVAAAEYGSKKAACAAAGLTGTFGYFGGAVSGVGVGYIADRFGWNAAIAFFLLCALIGALFFIFTWNVSSIKETKRSA